MTSDQTLKSNKYKHISFRLNTALLIVLCFYLIASYLSIHTLAKQANEFKALSGGHFDSAMNAAELARDAEVIAAQAIEQLISSDRSRSNEDVLNKNLVAIYQNVRQKLNSNAEMDEAQLEKIDKLQVPFFKSLKHLELSLLKEQTLIREKYENTQQLALLSQWLVEENTQESHPDFYLHALAALNYTSLALNTQSQGQLNKLDKLSQASFNSLSSLKLSQKKQQDFLNQIAPLLKSTIALQTPLQQSHRATLAAAREARLHAQRLSGSSYNYFLSLKEAAKKASQSHQNVVDKAINRLFIFTAIFVLLTGLTYFFIRLYIIRRLNNLSKIMQQHVRGKAVEIPLNGNDEIALIAQAFSVFVKARSDAEESLKKAHLETEEANRKLKRFNNQLQTLSETDELTQVANRRRFFLEANDKWQHALHYNNWIGIIMIDVDLFKSYNDHYGHLAGDECLLKIAQLLEQQLDHDQDLIARYGGEEFIIILPMQDQASCLTRAKRLLNTIVEAQLPHLQNPRKVVTWSMGVAACLPSPDTQVKELIKDADNALYQAKNQGRCQVRLAQHEAFSFNE